MSMNLKSRAVALALALCLGMAAPALAQEDVAAALSQRLVAIDASAEYGGLAQFERLQARQAIDALLQARSSAREGARYVAERRVEIAELAAETEAMRREINQLDRLRADLLIEASRRDAAQARAEAERLRIQAQIQAEETARLRREAATDAAVMEDVEAALQGVAGDQAAKLKAAREREAELARQEAELLRQIEEAEAAAEAAVEAEARVEAVQEAQAAEPAPAEPELADEPPPAESGDGGAP